MMNKHNFIPLNSFDFLFDLLSNFYNYDIVTVLPVLILCGGFSIVSFTFYSGNKLGEKIIKTAGTIGTIIAGGVATLESGLNLIDRLKGSSSSDSSGDSKNKDNKDNNDNNDNKDKNGK